MNHDDPFYISAKEKIRADRYAIGRPIDLRDFPLLKDQTVYNKLVHAIGEPYLTLRYKIKEITGVEPNIIRHPSVLEPQLVHAEYWNWRARKTVEKRRKILADRLIDDTLRAANIGPEAYEDNALINAMKDNLLKQSNTKGVKPVQHRQSKRGV